MSVVPVEKVVESLFNGQVGYYLQPIHSFSMEKLDLFSEKMEKIGDLGFETYLDKNKLISKMKVNPSSWPTKMFWDIRRQCLSLSRKAKRIRNAARVFLDKSGNPSLADWMVFTNPHLSNFYDVLKENRMSFSNVVAVDQQSRQLIKRSLDEAKEEAISKMLTFIQQRGCEDYSEQMDACQLQGEEKNFKMIRKLLSQKNVVPPLYAALNKKGSDFKRRLKAAKILQSVLIRADEAARAFERLADQISIRK